MEWILTGAGVFSIAGAVFNWDWFMNNRRAVLFMKMFGRNGARIFYGMLGSALVVMGSLLAAGVIEK